MNIDIITFSMGRWKYLKDCLESVSIYGYDLYNNDISINHHVIFQGIFPTDDELKNLKKVNRSAIFHYWKENIGIGEGLNRILADTNGELVIKFDEDAKIVSGYLEDLIKIYQAFPDRVFSPFVIGLQNNLGGVPGYAHEAHYDKEQDKYYMLRLVHHIGGIARCVPRKIYDKFKFANDLDPTGRTSGNEDGQFSSWCNQNKIVMMYMDTEFVVEHNEGTLCQRMRYPEYFEKRQ